MTTENTSATTTPSHDADADVNAVPSAETLTAAWDLPVWDRTGKKLSFKDIVDGPDIASRVLVIFIRHWWCPGYVRQLAEKATPEMLSNLPVKTSIAIVGSGGPQLIDHWTKEAACPFPVHAHNSSELYKLFNFQRDKGTQEKSEYQNISQVQAFLKSAAQIIKKPHKLHYGGDPWQNGGELLFEPAVSSGKGVKEVTWCHRMQHSTDHAKFADVLGRLGIEEHHGAASSG